MASRRRPSHPAAAAATAAAARRRHPPRRSAPAHIACACRVSLLLLLALLGNRPAAAYQSWEEPRYLSNFAALEAASYSAANDPSVAPPGLLDACRVANATSAATNVNGGSLDGRAAAEVALVADGVDETNPNVAVVSAASVQRQCGAPDIVCVVPRGLRLVMSHPLVVPALVVRGELYWRDADQSAAEQWLCAGYVAVEGPAGKFVMNLQSDTKRGWIYLRDNGAVHHHGRSRFFGGVGDASNVWDVNDVGPTVEVTGRKMQRTWSLLAEEFKAGQLSMKLMHSPVRMGWRVGDRLGVAPTQKTSDGTGHTFVITQVDDDGTVRVAAGFAGAQHNRKATFLPPAQAWDEGETRSAALLAAEVVNLSRNVVITGDDLRHVPCSNGIGERSGCRCGQHRSKCTLGLHTAQMHAGTMKIRNARVEKCGQRGINGKYCLHFHRLADCPDCEFSGNAVEHGHQRGIIVHGTHRSTVENNALWDVRGAGIYVEDGNEMHNQIKYNVVVCPHPLIHSVLVGCTVPGTNNAESDTPLNQAGFYAETAANDFVGNRASNSFNGLLLQASGSGRGAAYGRVCTSHLAFGIWEGNTFHGHSRFGLYSLGGSAPRDTDQSLDNDGFNVDQANTCKATTNEGVDRGSPVAILNNVDYDTIFVGHYNAGDMQHRGHVSYNNNNLIYWKETKNFADGCAAHITESYYAHGNMALPDQSTVIIERTTFEAYVVLEANHHCNVGVTGMLCMPSYIFHDVKWNVWKDGAWIWLQRGGSGGGGIFSLSPPNAERVMTATPEEQATFQHQLFPPGYVSLASGHYTYLESTGKCTKSNNLGLGGRYTDGILCREPLRALKVWSSGLQSSTAPWLKVEVWLDTSSVAEQSVRSPDITQMINFHQIAGNQGRGKQGYSLPVFLASSNVSYRLSLGDQGNNIPGDWILEFSDAVMGNRWQEEFLLLQVAGRFCENDGLISSQHSRKFIYGLGFDGAAWGNSGACVDSAPPKMPLIDCTNAAGSLKAGSVPSAECPGLCGPGCNAANSFCHCGLETCVCKPGFAGADCSIDLCANARCDHGTCAARYLGDASSLPVANKACICDAGWHGELCDKQTPVNLARSGTASQSSTCWDGPAGRAIDGNTNQMWGGSSITHTCQEDLPWWKVNLGGMRAIGHVVVWNRWDDCCRNRFDNTELQVLDDNGIVVASEPIVNGLSTNHIYFEGVVGREVRVQKTVYGDLNVAEVQVYSKTRGCDGCAATGECQAVPICNYDGSCPAESTNLEDGTPCNSKPMGTCQNGQCVEPVTPSPTFEPTAAPFTLTPTMYLLSDRTNLARGSSATASQSSTCYGGNAERAKDGNTNGNYYANSVAHTCGEAEPWWMLDMGDDYDFVISRISVWNRDDCCMSTLSGASVEVLDSDGEVVASQLIPAGTQNRAYHFDFEPVAGRFVRVKKPNGVFTIAEVEVLGWSLTKSPTLRPTESPTLSQSPSLRPSTSDAPTLALSMAPSSAPTRPLVNLARGSSATASQSSTCWNGGAGRAKDGQRNGYWGGNSVQHTCNEESPWWMLDMGDDYDHIISRISVYNRQDCCADRLSDSNVEILDSLGNVVASQMIPTGSQNRVYHFDFVPVEGRFVRIKQTRPSALNIAEVEVMGWSSTKSPTLRPTLRPTVSQSPSLEPSTSDAPTLALSMEPSSAQTQPLVNLARGSSATASQSSTCHGGNAGRAKDGNRNGYWGSNSVQHTCNEESPWWMLDMGDDYDHIISRISVYNRQDCCADRLSGSDVEVLDSDGNVVASQMIPTGSQNRVYHFDFEPVEGRFVRIKQTGGYALNIAEVEVMGWSSCKSSCNLSAGKVATQSSTYNSAHGPYKALDGNDNSITHTGCGVRKEWWQVDLGATYTVEKVHIGNRLDCCWDRLADFDIWFLDEGKNVVDSIFHPGTFYPSKDFSVGLVNARYVKIQLRDNDCVQLGTVEVWGY